MYRNSSVHSDGFFQKMVGGKQQESGRVEIAKAELTRQKSEKGERETGRKERKRYGDRPACAGEGPSYFDLGRTHCIL